jgi:hypothetical protein
LIHKTKPLKILHFDIENRPLSYWIPDQPTAEITAIAWEWRGAVTGGTECYLLGQHDPEDMLQSFTEAYDYADMVTGHYIRKHDLPIINGALLEYGLPTLKPKLTHDTKMDMIRKGGIPATQEHLSDMLGLKAHKYRMSQAMWRRANRLTEEGLAETEKRVVGDVKQHIQLREAMLKAGWLNGPKVWRP